MLKPRIFDIYRNTAILIITIFSSLKVNTKVLYISIRTVEFNKYRKLLGVDRVTNSILATI